MDVTGGSNALHFPHSHSNAESGGSTGSQGNCLPWPSRDMLDYYSHLLPDAQCTNFWECYPLPTGASASLIKMAVPFSVSSCSPRP